MIGNNINPFTGDTLTPSLLMLRLDGRQECTRRGTPLLYFSGGAPFRTWESPARAYDAALSHKPRLRLAQPDLGDPFQGKIPEPDVWPGRDRLFAPVKPFCQLAAGGVPNAIYFLDCIGRL